ncbi:hypothetical protein BG015_005320 [Linnemannia schmuckeri]|uniref:Ras guanine nucleotide exchange factor domain-containing protein n=1 Tax=Linnemannia schmuckeri TaxID=64567 RepID=A0A9P5S124_9FUNG|nr:hypothetical protein BG015_005320 [Linnemannia schmuckeri]
MSSEPWPADRVNTNSSNNKNNDIIPINTSSSSNSNIIIDNKNININNDDTYSSSVMSLNGPILPVTSASLLSSSTTQFSQPQHYQQQQQQQQQQEQSSTSSTNTHAHAGFPEDMTGGEFVATLHPLSSLSSPSLSPSPSLSSVIATSSALTTSTTMVPTLAAVTSQTDPRRDSANDEPSVIRINKERQQVEEYGAGAGGVQDKNTATSTTTPSTATASTTTASTITMTTATESIQPSLSTGTRSAVLSMQSHGPQTVENDGLVVIEEYASIDEGSTGDDHKDPVRDSTQSTIGSSFHITQSAADIVDKERLVSQLEIVPSKLDLPAKDISSRKSFSLTPLQTSPTASVVKKSIPATANQAATIDSENPYYSTSIAPISAATTPRSTVPNSTSGFNFHSGSSSERGSYFGIESPYPSPTPASSPIDYFAASWILPPIPSFSEMGLTFDKSRSNSTNSNTKREASDNALDRRGNESTSILYQQNHISHATHKPHRSGTDRRSAGTNTSEHQQQQQQEIVPDYDPSVFDQIISDENEAYIVWSTTPESGTGGAAVSASIIDTSPAVTLSRNNRSGAILSPSASQQSAQSIPTPDPSPSSASSTAKRWSAGESSKTKNQGRDSFDNDRVRAQTPTATTPSHETFMAQCTAHGGGSNAAFSSSSQPSSPGPTKPAERISGPISMAKPAFSGSSASSKANAKGTAVSGPATNKSTASQVSRVIMAATIEKLVEKLTSDIDYTFLTDFFLIYRLFISPPALLRLLMARFHWALTEDTPQRQIVRVRTFVVLRHWLLNYFEYDFMGFRLLRRTLIQNLKLLITHPIICSSVRDQRIVHELRRLFQLKRKQYSRTAAQRSLEGSAARREHSIRSVQHDNVEQNGSERSMFEEQLSGGESSDQDSELYSTDSQSEDDIQNDNNDDDMEDEEDEEEDDDEDDEDVYEEVSSYVIDEGYSQRDLATSDNDKDGSDLEAPERPNVDRRRTSVAASITKARLPSPTFSAGSRQSNDVSLEPLSSSHYHHYHHHVSASADTADGTRKIHARPRTSEFSENSPHHHHHRSHTVPHFHETRSTPRPRPLSYVSPSIDTSSSNAFSPPESPLPLDVYSSTRLPYSLGPSSNDKKKTWSQYMAATVGQLSKVKRVFKPKSSQSIQDLRSGGLSAMPSTQPFIPRGEGAVDREFTKFASMRSAAGPSRYWSEGRIQSDHRVSQSANMLNAMATTNSVISSGEYYYGAREYHDGYEHESTDRNGQWSSDEDEDLRSESTRKSMGDRANSRAMNHHTDHSSTYRQSSMTAQGRNHEGSRVAGAATPTEGAMEYGDSTIGEGEQRLLRTASLRGLDPLSDDQDLILEQRSLGYGPIPVEWNQLPSSFMSPSNNSRALRRTTPKRDNRASWMTFSSTSSSVFGAVLSQNHMPPSQAIRRGSEQLNVERFVERTFGSIAPAAVPAGEQRPAYRSMTRHKSTEALKTMTNEDSSTTAAATMAPLSNGDSNGKNTVQSVSPGMNAGRRSHTVAQHPHRQTVPIMHHHYHHHHYLQHRQSLQDYPPQRRHSTDVQTLQGWSASMTTSSRDKRSSADLSKATSHNTISLLEGAAYAAALQETQRQLKLMASQEGGHRAAPSPPPVTIPPHSQTFRGYSNGLHSPDFSVKSSHRISGGGSVEGRPYSNPNWRHLSDPDVSPLVVNNNKSPPKSNPTSTETAAQQRGVNRINNSWYSSNPSSSSQGVQQYQTRSQYENSYSQQRSPMTPRFQSIMSSASTVREYPSRAPASVVLRYRSETIAQQMCLIEREQLSEIQWFELVNAGWKKKSPEGSSSSTGTTAPAPSLSEDQNDDNEAVDGRNIEGSEMGRKNTLTVSGRTSRSLHERRHQSSESPSVVRLVDRFNLTCNWVTSEILKATDMETRVKVIEKFIRIAHTCYSYHNFSSLTQIMLGLQAHEVSRLSRTWARVRSQETKMMEDLVEFTSPFHNWKHLRNAMKTMAEEWGGAATGQDPVPVSVAVEVSSSSSTSGSKRQHKDGSSGGGLFSKIALSSKDKQKDQHYRMQHLKPQQHQQHQQQQQQQQYTAAQHHGVKSSTMTGHSSSHTKSFSGPVFPSLVSTLSSRDKDKDKDASKGSSLSQQPMGGCIPFLGVYLSDLLFNTELPSYVEPKVPAIIDVHPSPLQTTECLSSTTTSNSLNRLSTCDVSSLSHSSTSSPLAPSTSAAASNNHARGDPCLDPATATIDALVPATVIIDDFPSPSSSLPASSPSLSLTLSMSTSSTSTSSASPAQALPLPLPPSFSEQQQNQQQAQWMINMHKHRTIATIIRRILTFQKMAGRYPFLHDTEVYEALINAIESPSEQLSDSERERLSDLCEERFSMVGPLGPLSPSESLNSGLTSPAFSR